MKISKRWSSKIPQIQIPHKFVGFCVSVREAGENGIEELEMSSPFPHLSCASCFLSEKAPV